MIYSGSKKTYPKSDRLIKELIIEIELNGKTRFDDLLNMIYHHFGITYRIIKADIEFIGNNSIGNVQLLLETDVEQHQNLEFYLNRNKLLNTSIERINRKAV